MTPLREAVVLPALFLTVVMLGGLRIGVGVGDTTALIAPSPYFLVLGVLLVRLVVQSGGLAPASLMASSRSELANLNGATVLMTLWIASAQVFAMLTPDSGLPRIASSTFFLILLLATSAAAPDHRRMLRSLAITLGAAFVLKFVVLHALSAPGDGGLKRVLVAVLDGITVGALVQDVPHEATAYLALAALGLFFAAVSLLPRPGSAMLDRARPELPPSTWPAP